MNLKKYWFGFVDKYWWCPWSNIRYRKYERFSTELKEEDKVKTLDEIKILARHLYQNFEYTKDGFDKLGDAVCPPPYAYKKYKASLLKDDCDGFHSLAYNCLKLSGIECNLMTVVAKDGGHCVCIFYLDGLWHVLDYNRVYDGFANLKDMVEDYNHRYRDYYECKSDVFYNGFMSYNYKKGKFKMTSMKSITKRINKINAVKNNC